MAYIGLKPGTNYPEVSYNNLTNVPNSQKVVFTGNGVDDTYTLPVEPGVAENLDVTIDGVTQQPGTDYTLPTTTSIQFSTPLDNGMEAVIVYRGFAQGSLPGQLSNDVNPYLNGDLNVNGFAIRSHNNGDVNIFAHGTGKVRLEGVGFPTADGAYGEVLATDGAGNLFFTAAGGGGSNLTFANLGTGEGVFDQNNAGTIQFKSLIGGYGIDVSSTATDITLAFDPETVTIEDLADVDTNGAIAGSVLKWNGSNWVISTDLTGTSGSLVGSTTDDLAEGAANLYYTNTRFDNRLALSNLRQLADVSSNTPTNGQALVWNSTASEWRPGTVSGGGGGGIALTDLSVTVNSAGSANLTYNSTTGEFSYTPPDLSTYATTASLATVATSGNYNDLTSKPAIPSNLGDLSDVSNVGATNGQILTWVSANNQWEAVTGSGGGGIALTDLSVTVNAVGVANLTYNNLTGVFSYTPPDLSSYLTSYTETDPVFSAHTTSNIVDGTGFLKNTAGTWSYDNSTYLTDYTVVSGDLNTISIDALSDVDTTTATPSVGEVLKWNGANWAPAADNTGGGAGSGTVNTGTATHLAYYASTGSAVSGAGAGLTWNSGTSTLTATNISVEDITTTGTGTPTFTSANDIVLDANSGTGDVNVSGSKITNLGTPTVATDAATKAYVDASGGGIALTDLSVTVNAAGTANLTYSNTTGVFSYTPPDTSGFIAQQDAIQTEEIKAHTNDNIVFKSRFNTNSAFLDTTANTLTIGQSVATQSTYELQVNGDILVKGANQYGSMYNEDRYGTITPIGPAQPHGKHYGPITANGVGAYTFSGLGDNPTLTLFRGETYAFNLNASGHPFTIKTVQGTGTGNIYNEGTTNQGVEQGYMFFTVPLDAPDTLYYQCVAHNAMNGTINVTDRLNSFRTSGSLVTGFTSGFANADTARFYWNLPEAGDYMLYSVLRTYLWSTTGFIKCRLFNNTTSSAIAGTDRMMFEAQSQTMAFNVMSTPVWKVTVGAASTIYLQLNATTAAAGIQDDANGYNEQGWMRVH